MSIFIAIVIILLAMSTMHYRFLYQMSKRTSEEKSKHIKDLIDIIK